MRAWDKLTSGSTLPDGTAWDHLNAQGGGGGIVYVESMAANLVEAALVGSIEQEVLSAEMTTVVLSAKLSEQVLEAGIQVVALDADFVDLEFSGSTISMNLSANIVEAA